tara:strand:+ start:361 stop:759 length:399 start_codon:yes stop_codon:yes gene_type:complete
METKEDNVIDATELFEMRRFHGVKNVSQLIDAAEREDFSDDMSKSMIDILVQMFDEYDFDVEDTKMIDDLTFINIIIRAVVDRQLGIPNPICLDIDNAVDAWKDVAEMQQKFTEDVLECFVETETDENNEII